MSVTPQPAFLERRKQLLIGGEWVDGAEGRTLATFNPATGEPLAEVALAGEEDVNRAVAAARRAFGDGRWTNLPYVEKTKIMLRIADLLDANREELAQLETLDNGKPLAASRREVEICADTFRYYAGWPSKITGDVVPSTPDRHVYVRREPLGVCAQIIPWNAPIVMASWKVAPVLATGNTCVLKPAEQTPLTAIRLAELCLEAGVPEGVVNLVQGGGEVGAALVAHPDVDKIAFTGSTETGKRIAAAAAQTLKKVSLELGGKSPNVVFADADVDAAAATAALACFRNTGQICYAGTRLLLQRSIHDEFVERLKAQAEALRVGPGWEDGVDIGPLVSQEQLDRVGGYLELGRSEGAQPVAGGSTLPGPGYFVQPTVFTEVDNEMRIAQEEIFGPVLSVLPFDDVDDAIAIGNRTIYGLGAAVWTRDVSKAHRFAAAIHAGTVWVNTFGGIDPATPFGGYKQSGQGREFGEASLELYTQLKSVIVQL
jgi:phenylacetaldehyde dehydrogenase